MTKLNNRSITSYLIWFLIWQWFIKHPIYQFLANRIDTIIWKTNWHIKSKLIDDNENKNSWIKIRLKDRSKIRFVKNLKSFQVVISIYYYHRIKIIRESLTLQGHGVAIALICKFMNLFNRSPIVFTISLESFDGSILL